MAWHIEHLDLNVISDVQEKSKNSRGGVLYHRVQNDETEKEIQAYDQLCSVYLKQLHIICTGKAVLTVSLIIGILRAFLQRP